MNFIAFSFYFIFIILFYFIETSGKKRKSKKQEFEVIFSFDGQEQLIGKFEFKLTTTSAEEEFIDELLQILDDDQLLQLYKISLCQMGGDFTARWCCAPRNGKFYFNSSENGNGLCYFVY
jgi:hypothetical protein